MTSSPTRDRLVARGIDSPANMWGTVLLMAIVTAVDPAQIGPVAYILSRRSPMRRLVAYLIGGFGVSIIAGSVIVFALGLAEIGKSSSIPPGVEIAVGASALLFAAALAASGFVGRLRDRVRSRHVTDQPDPLAGAGDRRPRLGKLPGFDKLPRRLQDALRSESPWLAWVYGAAFGIPDAYYLAALAAILKSGAGTAGHIAALLVFNVVAFTVAEVALVSWAVAPEQTRVRLDQLHSSASTHRRLLVTVLASTVGVYLILVGISEL